MDLQVEKEQLNWSHVQAQFEALAASEEIQEGSKPCHSIRWSAVLRKSSKRGSARRAYAQRLGTDNASSPRGHIFISGKYYVINVTHYLVPTSRNSSPVERNLLESLQASVGQALQYFQEKVSLLLPDCRHLTMYSIRVKLRMKRWNRHVILLGCWATACALLTLLTCTSRQACTFPLPHLSAPVS